jgi:hypothetical protein
VISEKKPGFFLFGIVVGHHFFVFVVFKITQESEIARTTGGMNPNSAIEKAFGS